jgi:hypothetical protein
MFFTKKTALVSAAAVCAVLISAPIANAADANVSDCIHMAKQVKTALESAQPGSKTDVARNELRFGRDYCANSMFVQGVAHYSKALELLKS